MDAMVPKVEKMDGPITNEIALVIKNKDLSFGLEF